MRAGASRLVSVRISEADHAKLEQEATTLGLKPAVLARLLLRLSLNEPRTLAKRHSRHEVEKALARLDRLATAGATPAFDAVELIRRARDERAKQVDDLVFSDSEGG